MLKDKYRSRWNISGWISRPSIDQAAVNHLVHSDLPVSQKQSQTTIAKDSSPCWVLIIDDHCFVLPELSYNIVHRKLGLFHVHPRVNKHIVKSMAQFGNFHQLVWRSIGVRNQSLVIEISEPCTQWQIQFLIILDRQSNLSTFSSHKSIVDLSESFFDLFRPILKLSGSLI